MRVIRFLVLSIVALAIVGGVGCGLDHEYLDGVQVSPAGGTATAATTSNTVQFTATGWYSTANFAGTAPTLHQPNQHKVLTNANWTTSDSANTSIDSKGVATCLSPTSSPVLITATAGGGLYGSVSGTATLICN